MKKVLYITIIYFIAITFNSCKKTGLVVDFSFDGNYVQTAPAEIHFTNLTSGGTNYTWDFGDGSATSNEKNPVHTYTKKNMYKVTLYATNSSGEFMQIVKNINIGIMPPTIDFLNGDSIIIQEMASYKLSATLKSDTNTTLKSIIIFQRIGANGIWNKYYSKSLNVTSYLYENTNVARPGNSQITFKFVLQDNKDIITTKYYNLFVIPATGPWGKINLDTGTLWNQWVSTGQFWSIQDAKSYGISSAKANAANIDFVFGHRVAANGAFIGSPFSSDANYLYNNVGPDDLSTWSILNATLFKLTSVTPSEFAQCSNDSLILYNTFEMILQSSYRNIKANDVIAFTTASGKRGLLWVKSVSGYIATQLAGSLVFEYKTTQ